VNDNGKIITVDVDEEEQKKYDSMFEQQKETKYELEAGYYDSNGKLNHGKYYGPLNQNKSTLDNIDYSLEEMRMYEKHACRKPTEDNPFMNLSVDDFNKENVPIACNADDEDVHNNVVDKFNSTLYRDIDDVFNKMNSQRQFFTVAHSIPNDQEAFARWCYKFPKTCKEDQERCMRYEDIRMKY
jgi:hypothetical protein